jgi:hypothetical protein
MHIQQKKASSFRCMCIMHNLLARPEMQRTGKADGASTLANQIRASSHQSPEATKVRTAR